MERESRMLEYKCQATDLRNIARTVVAFANGSGGRLLIGIDDKTRKPCGLPEGVIDGLLERIPVSLADQIQPPLFPQVFEKSIEGNAIVVIQVFPGGQPPYFIALEGMEKGVYIRVGAHTRRAEGLVLEELRLLRSHCGFDQAPVLECPISELDMTILPASLRAEKSLLSLDIVRRDAFSGNLFPTRGGILMLHKSPERYVEEAYIVASKMRGASGRDTVESIEIAGNLPRQSEVSFEILAGWLGKNPKIAGVKNRNSTCSIPPVVFREAINNALFHRQYSIPGPIKIALFADRLEIFSPGHFAGPFIPDELGDGTSYIRNRVIGLVARRLGLIEKRGTGIRVMQEAMRDVNLPPPIFEEGPNWFKVTLVLQNDRLSIANPADYEQSIMDLFEKKPLLSSSDVCKELGVSKATGIQRLDTLIKNGRIVRIGSGPSTKYRVSGY